jgi:hypothetical protein
MAAQFDSHPAETYMPANQPLIYTISDTGGAVNASHRFVVEVVRGASTDIAKVYLTANTNNKAHFDLSSIVKDLLTTDHLQSDGSGTLWEMSTIVDHSLTGTAKFTVKIGTFNGSTETLNQASKSIYLVNGSQQIREGLHPDFSTYYATGSTKKVWLTERTPDSVGKIQFDFADEDEGVIAWIHDSNIISGIDAKVSYVLLNSSNSVLATASLSVSGNGGNGLTSTAYGQKLHFTGLAPASLKFTSSALPANNPTWAYYVLLLTNSAGNVSASMAIQVNKKCGIIKNQRVQIAYANRLGGWDYLTFDGNTSKKVTAQNKPYYKALGDYDAAAYTFDPSDRTSVPYQITSENKYTLRAQNFGVEENYMLEGLMMSDNVYMRYGDSTSIVGGMTDRDKWLPVLVDTTSLVIRDKVESRIFDVSLEVTLAQESRC